MSGICGILNLKGRKVEERLTDRLNNVMPHLGMDSEGIWVSGEVGLGYRLFCTTPESNHESQPLLDETRRICIVFDGRLDNRSELRNAIIARGEQIRSETDSELVIKAYICWEEGCFIRFLGDFSVAIWDGYKRTMFCARDYIGLRPFYYFKNEEVFVFGTEIKQVLEHPAVSNDPNEGMIGEYLCSRINNAEETIYKDIRRLPPAHYFRITSDRFESKRYWDIDPNVEIRYKSDQDYADHFMELFERVIDSMTRCDGELGVELSGGLDSSSIAAIACQRKEISTFSLVFPGNEECDESVYIDALVSKYNLKSYKHTPSIPDGVWFKRQVSLFKDFPWYPNGYAWYELWREAKRTGTKVILSGAGGDEWFSGSYMHYADYLKNLELLKLVKQVIDDRQFRANGILPAITTPPLTFFKFGLFPLVPASIKKPLKALLRPGDAFPSWIPREFLEKNQQGNRYHSRPDIPKFKAFEQQSIANQLYSGALYLGNELATHYTDFIGLEVRCPFMDRRIVEFGIGLPADQRWRGKWTKFILRKAMGEMLPNIIEQRTTKADFSHLFAETIQKLNQSQPISELSISSLGWVDQGEVNKLYRRMVTNYKQGNLEYLEDVWPLWQIIGIDMWTREINNSI